MAKVLASPAQKATLFKMLAKRELIGMSRSERTGPAFRPLFKVVGTIETGDWPLVDEWVGTLTVGEASTLIKLLSDM